MVTSDLDIHFRKANKSDLESLNKLIRASKATWGYSDEFMDKFMHLFRLTEKSINSNIVHVMLMKNHIIGMCSFNIQTDETLELDDFFIHPDYIGQGLGRKLWFFSCQIAKQLCKNSFILWSDPEAEAFYLKMGCNKIGMKKSPLMPNREAPVMQYILNEKLINNL